MAKKVSDILGDQNSKMAVWASLRGFRDAYQLDVGCSVHVTCNQDKKTIKRAQELGAPLAIHGIEVMADLLGRGYKHIIKFGAEDG